MDISPIFLLPLAFVGIVATIALGIGAAWLSVGPADQAARRRKVKHQYTLTDIFSLLIILQVTAAPAAWLFRQELGMVPLVVWAFLWGAATALWWASVGMMGRAGVTRPLKRILFVLVVLPLAVTTTLTGFGIPGMLLARVDSLRGILTWVAMVLAWCGVVIVTRLLTLWIIREENDASDTLSAAPLQERKSTE